MATDLWFGLLPEHLLLGTLLVLMVLEMCKAPAPLGNALVMLALMAAGVVLVRQYSQGYAIDLLPEEIRIDRFALLAKLVIIGSGLAWAFVFTAQATYKSGMLLCSCLLGACVMMDSAGFIPLVLGIEMLSLPAFALMVHGAGASVASEGAFKYLLLSSIASALIMFGIAFSYGATGTLAIDAFVQLAVGGSAQGVAATVLIVSGFLFKAAVFPFHAWAPDAYSSVRVHVTAFLAALVKGAVILGLVRILSTAPLSSTMVAIVATLGVISILYGNTTAIRQTTFKRMLAYSSIAHAGYMMFAFVDTTGGRVSDLLWYVVIYALTVIVACASFQCVVPRRGRRPAHTRWRLPDPSCGGAHLRARDAVARGPAPAAGILRQVVRVPLGDRIGLSRARHRRVRRQLHRRDFLSRDLLSPVRNPAL